MLIIGKWGLFLCSILGYVWIIQRKGKVESTFAPITGISLLGLLVYLGGLAGFLKGATYGLLSIGIILAICGTYDLLKNQRWNLSKISLFQVCFWMITFFFLVPLLTTKLEHYDNFSHWAIVVKQMLSTNAFPDAASAIIDFRNYPLGTSSFLYYGCRIIGHDQGTMLVIQGILIFACFYALFGIIQEKKRFLLYSFLGAGCAILSVFNITIRINNLLVDFILPLMTLVMFAVIYRYREELWKACIILIPIGGFLTVVKSTGIIFGLFGFLYLFYMTLWKRKNRNIKQVLASIGTMLIAMAPIGLWQLHMKLVFVGQANKFDVSAENINQVYGAKTQEDIQEIVGFFLRSATDLKTRPAIGILLFEILAIVAVVIARFLLKKKWALFKTIVAMDILLVFYYGGILAMYVYSMPLEEALILAGFDRYASSIVVLFVGGLLLCTVVDMEHSFYIQAGDRVDYKSFRTYQTKNYYQMGVVATVAIGAVLLLSEYNGLAYNRQQYNTSMPAKMEAIVGDRWYEGGTYDESRYLIYAPDYDAQVTNYYAQYVARYYLYAPHVDGICLFYEDNMENLLSDYDYLVIVEDDWDERRLMKKHYGVDGDSGIYKISELLEEKGKNS